MTNGPHTPTVVANGIKTSKPIQEYNEDDKKLASMNAKAINILYCALERKKFNRISTCINAHDIWHLLEITHEGTTKLKIKKSAYLCISMSYLKWMRMKLSLKCLQDL